MISAFVKSPVNGADRNDMDSLVCPQCQAKNAPDTQWCSQCYEPFESAEDHVDQLASVTASGAPSDFVGDAPAEHHPPKSWVCRLCDSANPVEESVCENCGVSIFDSVAPQTATVVQADAVLRRGIMVPGLGYASVNRSATGVVVGFLAVVSLLTGLAMTVAGAVLAGLLMVLVALAVWATSAIDAYRVSRGEKMLVQPRVLSVAGAMVVLIILVTVAQVFSRANG